MGTKFEWDILFYFALIYIFKIGPYREEIKREVEIQIQSLLEVVRKIRENTDHSENCKLKAN